MYDFYFVLSLLCLEFWCNLLRFFWEKKSQWWCRGLESSQKEMYQILYTWQGYCYTKCYCYFSCQILVPFIQCIAASSSIIPNSSVIPSAKTSNWTVSQPSIKRVKSVHFIFQQSLHISHKILNQTCYGSPGEGHIIKCFFCLTVAYGGFVGNHKAGLHSSIPGFVKLGEKSLLHLQHCKWWDVRFRSASVKFKL